MEAPMTTLAAPRTPQAAPATDPTPTPRAPRRRLRPLAILAASVIVVAGSYAVSTAIRTAAPPATTPASAANQPAAPIPAAIAPPDGPASVSAIADGLSHLDGAIKAWTTNLSRNPKDFLSATYLSLSYEARGRLSGNLDDYLRAKSAADSAVAALPGDLDAEVIQARLLQTLHDFPGALRQARSILQTDPSALQALATSGDAQLELGDVKGARAAFNTLQQAAPGAAVTARLSRLAFVTGDTTNALSLAKRAYDEAHAAGQTGPALGWYAYVVGTVSLSTGSPAPALTWFDTAAGAWPDSFLVLGGKARAEAALGQRDAAIATLQQAIAIAPQPDTLTILGDLYALRGDTKLANQQYATVEAIAHLAAVNEQVYNRQLVLFSVNHDRDLAQALVLAQQELAVRKDAYGYDAEAWALLANGRAADADAAMRQAFAFGTKDALLSYHAGMIATTLGDTARARAMLQDAVSISGGLDPLAASEAAAALAALP
jgi:tetratricopeptide (TPR) repeat protein